MKDEACAALVNSALDGSSPVNSNQPPYNPADYPNAAQNKMITLSNGKLTVSSKVSSYVWYNSSSYYQVLYILCIATTTDGTNLMDYCMYNVVPPTKTLKTYDTEEWKPYTLYILPKNSMSTLYNFDVYVSSNSMYVNQFTVKSSNPDIASAVLVDNDTLRIYTGTKTGTATITITANDGSGKKTTFKVKTVN